MSELRQDAITGRWVVIAETRGARPDEYGAATSIPPLQDCPFCDGHESWTPPEIVAYRTPSSTPDGPGWTVRTIPNKFPSVSPDAPTTPPTATPGEARHPGFGLHEVIIESPSHSLSIGELPSGQVREIVRMLRDRVRAAAAHPGLGAVVLFENAGPESGGSLFHPHAQLVALPEIPPVLLEESVGLGRFARSHGGVCAFEAELAREREGGLRVIWDAPELLAYAPFASSHPFEVRFLPFRHAASLGMATDAELDRLAELLPRVLRALRTTFPGASYNFVARSFANGRPEELAYHWHLDVIPRLVRPDGFEVGGGIPLNTVAPETAAAQLRAALHSGGRSDTSERAVP